MIRGGRNPFLRERSTLKALQALASENILAKDKAEMLSKIYVFLRNVEHALQYENDQQTQLFAADPRTQKENREDAGLYCRRSAETVRAFDGVRGGKV